MTRKRSLFFLIIGIFFSACSLTSTDLTVQNLRIEGREKLLGLETQQPRLSWQFTSPKKNTMQTAYQILVASSEGGLSANEADLWDSGKVTADSSINVSYKGAPLDSYQDGYWKVMVWTNHGDSAWSETAHWKMGMLDPVDWQATWVGLDRKSTRLNSSH